MGNIKSANSLTADWNELFPEIMADGGFDCVVGNPPYIMEDENKSAFEGLHNLECYQGKTDIWHLFSCKAIEITKDNGYISFIAKNQWLNSASASNMRKNIYKYTEIQTIIDFGVNLIFENVGQQTMIFVLQKNKNNSYHNINYLKFTSNVKENQIVSMLQNPTQSDYTTVTQKKLSKNYNEKENLTFSSLEKEIILNKIEEKKNFEFDSKKEIIQGIIGGPDKAFIVKENELVKFNSKEKEYIKMLHTNTGIYITPKSDKYIFYISKKNFSDKNIEDYPNIYKQLNIYKEQLEKRREVLKGSIKWFNLWWARDEEFFKKGAKLVWAKRTEGRKFTYTENEFYGTANLFFIKSNRVNLKYLTALLNSKLFYFYMSEKLKHTGDLLQIDKNQFMKIPLYVPDELSQFVKLVDIIIDAKEKIAKYNKHFESLNAIDKIEIKENIEKLESVVKNSIEKINNMVYGLYGLSNNEIGVIENA
jgi:adenine-specific DNA-methyltransferase